MDAGGAGSGRAHGAAPAIDDDSLMLFEDGLRANLPGIDEIMQRAARRKRKTEKKVAAAALTLIAAGLLWLDPVYRSEQLATATGERGTWALEDGSEVTLNTASTLRVDYHLRSRQLYLPEGEALFKVRHSHWRSFLVHAHMTRVEDIGTVFNVRNTAGGAQVTVLEGSVEVRTEGEHEAGSILHADQAIEVDDGRLRSSHRVNAGQAMAWQNGKLFFDATPLAEVVAEVQRYRAAPVRLAPVLDGLRVSGQFDIGHIDQMLAMLPTLAPVTVSRKDDGSILIAPK